MSKWSDFQGKREVVRAIFILDESGSMMHEQKRVIDGFNENVQDMRKDPAEVDYLVTLIKFSSEVNVVYRDLPLARVKDLTSEDYMPNGMTALLDAVGYSIEYYPKDQKNVMLHIFTDGYENASRKYNTGQIKELVQSRQDVNKWAVVYLGADEGAWMQGSNMLGVYASNTVNYRGDTLLAFDSVKSARHLYSASVAKSFSSGSEVDNSNLFSGNSTLDQTKMLNKDSK